MPSKRKQLNVRMDDETADRIDRLMPTVRQALGLEISVSDLFRLGMIELERRYLLPSEGALASPAPAPKRPAGGKRAGGAAAKRKEK